MMTDNPHPRIVLGGTSVDLLEHDEAIGTILDRACATDTRPLAVLSANVDHINHFGAGGRWAHTLDAPLTGDPGVEWLSLIDGSPLATRAHALTGHWWPRLAGSDLIGPILDEADRRGLRVGVVGGSEEAQLQLRDRVAVDHPDLAVVGMWSPERDDLTDPERCEKLAASIATQRVDVLLVGLGKPRQELWISEYGAATGARVLLAFGAVVDFLAGRIRRAPRWVVRSRMEWAWRLMLEPRRLARRYLVEGPVAYLRLRRDSALGETSPAMRIPETSLPLPPAAESPVVVGSIAAPAAPVPAAHPGPGFVGLDGHADVAVLVVTYNSAASIGALLESLLPESADLRLRVVVADNASVDDSVTIAGRYENVITVPTGGNLGYAAGVNRARAAAGSAGAFLVLNPDLTVTRGSISTLLARQRHSGAGIAVPLLTDENGTLHTSLRREPTLLGTWGDALLGDHLAGRPSWLSETDHAVESYQHAHQVEWATGAAVLIASELAELLGDWDERFFLYSEETDYFRRARQAGASIWFEPGARMVHAGGGSGGPADLTALMIVNRVRYAELHHSRSRASAFRVPLLLGSALRSGQERHRRAVWNLLSRTRWEKLPHAQLSSGARLADGGAIAQFPAGSIIIPAHDESAVIASCLTALAPLADTGHLEIIVVCNGCTDGTAQRAREFPGVTVLEIDEASKTAALNEGDAVATLWPRIYLDADVGVSAETIRETLIALGSGDTLAARPQFRYDLAGCSGAVRAYYRARTRMPSSSAALWGAGMYAVTEAGHDRFSSFPTDAVDDVFVHRQFVESERVIVTTIPVDVRVPRTTSALIRVLGRTNSSRLEESTTGGTLRELLATTRGAGDLIDTVIYASCAILARSRGRRRTTEWARDDTSRVLEEVLE
ncbi:WecB/TagA/CpsF family glycosyltransferase [Glaciihabitans sp. dw_435]|uniref:WecB/TagA/CpsF family glycosyltransferase n=1 Tax=Glaciihabitans sp. dw_435 TaxID=2720081 RepID=UPI001BD2066D|nr:WecB/TagA/CpsF family glycosyltransferase [Glaciihabitans sp. dw_435]